MILTTCILKESVSGSGGAQLLARNKKGPGQFALKALQQEVVKHVPTVSDEV